MKKSITKDMARNPNDPLSSSGLSGRGDPSANS